VSRPEPSEFPQELLNVSGNFEFQKGMDYIWGRIQDADARIASEEPYKVVKVDAEKGRAIIAELALEVYSIARFLKAFMPETAETIKAAVLDNKKPENLFPRLT
jgi:methionyl-tRNA synthetase